MDDFFLWLAHNFDHNLFLKSTIVQGFFWSIADFCVVFGFLRLASFVRNRLGMKRTVFRYILFWIAAILNPYFLFYKTGKSHDMLILSIFFLMIYAALVDSLRMLAFIRQILSNPNRPQSA